MKSFVVRVVTVVVPAAVLIACASGSPRSEACSDDAILEERCVLTLTRGAGSVRLPPGALVEPLGSNSDGKHIVLEDSTVVEIWVTEVPADGLATTGGIGIDSTWRADTVIAGRPAAISTFRLVSPAREPEYVGLGFITVNGETAINFSVSTATPPSRDNALRFIAASVSPGVR